MQFNGRTVVITGATGGAGQAAARAFAHQGAKLALISRRHASLTALATSLEVAADRCLTLPVDLRQVDTAQAAARVVAERYGPANILLHLVGGWAGGKTIEQAATSELDSMLAQHVWTTWHLLQAFGPQLASAGWGRVIVVSHPVAAHPTAKSGAYAAAKAAQEALLLTLAQELGPAGVTANVLQVRHIDVEGQRLSAPSPANAGWTTSEELVQAIFYLCSEAGGRVNGVRLPLHGLG
jgi:NAD(P)-dependent dehydrogenase (short-subunit alcohol dehydrogenase family)